MFFTATDAIARLIDILQGLGICLGAAILFVIGVIIFDRISTRLKQKFKLQSKNYLVRCYAVKMKKIQYGEIPDNLPEGSPPETARPVLATIAMTNYGLWISSNPGPNIDKTPDLETGYFHQQLENLVIPVGNAKLYYVPYSREGDLEIATHPANSAGFTDAVPKLQEGYHLKIVLVFSYFINRNNLQEITQLEHPIKLKLTVLNNLGKDDLTAALGLYKLIVDEKKKFEAYDDDSWMYHSRPMY